MKPRWKPYPKMKDSGVEWIGEVPEGWATKRLRFVASINPPKSNKLNDISDVDFFPMENIGINGGLACALQRPLSELLTGFTPFEEGDTIIAKITPCFENGKGALATNLTNGLAFGTTELHVLRPNQSLDQVFLFWIAFSHAFRSIGASYMYGAGGQKRVPESWIKDHYHPIPPLPEQRAIAAFLDRETTRLDELIAKKERLIQLLQEKRSALITHAVTKGIQPGVKMKDSGVEWIGEVPEGWEALKIKYVATLRSGHTPSRNHPEYWENCTIPWISLADVWQLRDGKQKYIQETKEMISELGLSNSAARLLPKGTVILSRTASVGYSAIMRVDMATTQDFANWVCSGKVRPEFLLYAFRAMKAEFSKLMMGSTHQTIYMPDIEQFSTPLPSLHEQDEIVCHIDRETTRIDDLIAKVRQAITALTEYRSALISSAVTGKIDVRGTE